jgi:hypothetical protein
MPPRHMGGDSRPNPTVAGDDVDREGGLEQHKGTGNPLGGHQSQGAHRNRPSTATRVRQRGTAVLGRTSR